MLFTSRKYKISPPLVNFNLWYGKSVRLKFYIILLLALYILRRINVLVQLSKMFIFCTIPFLSDLQDIEFLLVPFIAVSKFIVLACYPCSIIFASVCICTPKNVKIMYIFSPLCFPVCRPIKIVKQNFPQNCLSPS